MEHLLVIGTLNRETPYFQGARGNGLVLYAFDEAQLSFRKLAEYPQVENPTFLSVTPDGRRIYTNSEVADWREGLVTAFAYDPAQGLRYLNTQASLGSITAHSHLAADGRLYVVNYTVGTGGPDQSLVIFDRKADGSLAPAGASVAHQGQGPKPDRQERAHAHSVTEVAPGVVVVADLGTDQLITYRIGAGGVPKRLAETATVPGAGPRHAAVHPGGRFLFVMNELDSTVTAHGFDSATGKLTLIDRQPAVPEAARQGNHCSDIQISPDGRYLYGANRGHDSVVVFAVDQDNGRLTPQGHTASGGATPRQLQMSPSGAHLLVANQNGDCVTVLARDAATGALSDTGKALQIGTPMCLKFAQL